MNKPLMILLSLVLCVMSGACVTPDLYKKPVKTTFPMNKPSFDEEVSSFLITNDQQQLVIIGKEHHYIFPIYNDLRETLMWSGRSKIMASNLRFVISKDNKINGYYDLITRDGVTLTNADKTFLDEHNFYFNGIKEYVRSSQLRNGKVYSAGKFKMPEGQSFNQPYTLNISYDYATAGAVAGSHVANAGAVAERVLLTPLAIAADGAIIVGAVVASPIILLFLSMSGGLNVH
jgi:hypothetical protein